jgi:integrase/recombinase XerC
MLTEIKIITTTTWTEAWAAWLKENDRSEKTISAYLQDLRHFGRWYEQVNGGQAFSPDQLNRTDVRSYFEWQAQTKTAVNSRNRRLASLRVLVEWGRSIGILDYDPTDKIKRADQSKLPPRAKDNDEYNSLLSASAGSTHLKRHTEKHALLGLRDEVIFGLMARAGLRIAEVAGLDVADLHLDEGTIRVLGKGNKLGWIRVGSELAGEIRRWLEERKRHGISGISLVCNWDGERLSTSQIRRRILLVGQAAGVKVKPHDLRHTYIYRLLDVFLTQQDMALPVAIDAVRQQARHSDSRTTMMYLRASDNQIKQAVEAL